MNNEQRETNYIDSSPPYVDPLVILNGNNVNSQLLLIRKRNRLHYLCDYFLRYVQISMRIFPILVFLLFPFYQLALACYNCKLEHTNLGWIRAAFFLNIPFILGVFIYLIIMLRSNKMITFNHFFVIIGLYITFIQYYTYFLGIYFEIGELAEIRRALNNATVVNSLPCPASHYRQMYGAKIASYCFPVLLIFVIFYPCFLWEYRFNENNTLNRFISTIIHQWRNLTNIIFSRHQEEIIIQRI